MGDQDPVILASYGSHRGGVNALHFRPHMKHVVSGGADSVVLLWSLHCRPNLRHPVVRPYRFLGHQVHHCLDLEDLRICYDLTLRESVDLQCGIGPVYSVAVSPLDNVVASGSKDKTVRLWLPTVEAKSSVLKAHGGAVRTVAFSYDGQFLLTGSDDKTIKVWLVHGQKFLATLAGHMNWVRSAEFHPDGGTIVSGSDDRTVRLWDLERHECLQQFSDGMGMINSVRFHPNGSLLATGGSDNYVQIWDIRSKMLVQHYVASAGIVNSVCFHPSGNFLLSTCEDSTIRVWDLREGQVLYSLQGHEGPTLCAEFSPTGEYFASGSVDEHVMLWRTNFDDSICLPQGLLGPIHEEGPHVGNCMACQCACKTSKDLADKILGGDSRTNIPDPKVKQHSEQQALKDMDPDVSLYSGPYSQKSPWPRSPLKHHQPQSPQRSPKTVCQASFETRKEKENWSQPESVAHSPTIKNGRNKTSEDSKTILETFGKTLEHIVGQLDVLTRTVSLFEERLSHTENKMLNMENYKKKQRPRVVEA